MRVYFAGYFTGKEVEDLEGDFGVLFTYLEAKQRMRTGKSVSCKKPILLDSSAFSVFTGRAKVDVKDYGEFLLKYGHLFDVYGNLDVIGDYKATQANQEYLESLGLHPMPTFHYGSPYSVLEEMVKKYDYIGLGGLVPLALQRNVLEKHLTNCFKYLKTEDGKIVKTHGWGMTNYKVHLRFPFWTADSTSWIASGRYGQVVDFKNHRLAERKDLKKFNSQGMSNLERYLHNANSYIRMAEEITKLWERRGIKFK